MRAEIVAVGTELLLGQIANTNAQWMSERLAEIGVDVVHHQVVGDNLDRIVEGLRRASARADVLLVSGGLGPTQDDLTRDAIAAALGVPLRRRPELEAWLRERFAGFSTAPMPASNLRQADVPEGAEPIDNPLGSAPGLIADLDGARLYAVPGVPGEMRDMMDRVILPELRERAGAGVIASRVIHLTGMGESAVAEVLDDLFTGSVNPTVAYLASMGEVKVRLTSKAGSREEAAGQLAPMVDEVVRRLGDVVFSTEDESLEEVVLRLLRAQGLTVAVAESLTGGGVSARLAGPPGASASFRGGVVAYQEDVKHDVLGVTRATLDGPGPVSSACALEMAAGVRRLLGSGPRHLPHRRGGTGGARGHAPRNGVDRPRWRRGLPCPGAADHGRTGADHDGRSKRRWTWSGATSTAGRSRRRPRRSEVMARDRSARPEAKPLRLFVAIEVPDGAKDAVARAFAPWREAHPRARWTPRENQHVTLKFLGRTWPRLSGVGPRAGGRGRGLLRSVRDPARWCGRVPVGAARPRAVGRARRPRGAHGRGGARIGCDAVEGVRAGDEVVRPPPHRGAVGPAAAATGGIRGHGPGTRAMAGRPRHPVPEPSRPPRAPLRAARLIRAQVEGADRAFHASIPARCRGPRVRSDPGERHQGVGEGMRMTSRIESGGWAGRIG